MSETLHAKKELREAKKLTGQGQVTGDEDLDLLKMREDWGEREREGRRKTERIKRDCVCVCVT